MSTPSLSKELIQQYNVQGPRYTSYPTVPNWSEDVTYQDYSLALQNMGKDNQAISLYIHIPYCEKLCTFCGCMVKIRPNKPSVGDHYLDILFKELDLIDQNVQKKKDVFQFHIGGGTPNFLSIDQMQRLWDRLAQSFNIDADGEIAIEIDPRTVSHEQLKHYRKLGFNRISMGIQDFELKVQEAINRIQPFNLVQSIFATCRELDYESINFDLIYGLPFQTQKTFLNTVEQVNQLRPDRIALYSFAHVPWLKKHQKLIDLASLPKPEDKLDIFLKTRQFFLEHDYDAIAMDHFALKSDAMAQAFHQGALYRNFMGYTLRYTQDFIGLGLSSIGFVQNTFVQNHKNLNHYQSALEKGFLATERGKVLHQDDQIRLWIINAFMCQFSLNTQTFEQIFGLSFGDYFQDEQAHIQNCLKEGLLTQNGYIYQATELGKLFIRNICMGFDAYFKPSKEQRFSQTI